MVNREKYHPSIKLEEFRKAAGVSVRTTSTLTSIYKSDALPLKLTS
jgi:hypothetical protein